MTTPETPSVTLRVGVTYRTRKGKLVRIIRHDTSIPDSCFCGQYVGCIAGSWWYPDGRHLGPDRESELDLIAEQDKTMPEMEEEIDALEQEIALLSSCVSGLRWEYRRVASREFIARHQITKADVHCPNGEGMPYFGMIWTFADWAKTQEKRRWLSWNGELYLADEIFAGRMEQNPIGLYADVP